MDLEKTVKSAELVEALPKDERMAVAVSDDEFVAPPMVEEDEVYDFEPPPSQGKMSKKKGKKENEEEEEERDEEKQSKGKLAVGGAFCLKLLTSFLDFLSAFFNRRSRDHRYVSWVLNKEKILLKQKMAEVL